MARIFTILALLAVTLLAANFVIGLTGGDFNAAVTEKIEAQRALLAAQRKSLDLTAAKEQLVAADAAFHPARSSMTLHMLLGSAAAMLTLLVNSITITYFIGTSRWCKEVCETYRLPAELAQRSTKLKRNTFPWALLGILTVIFIVGLGAAADPSGANFRAAPQFVLPHYLVAAVGLVVIIAAFVVQISRIAENYAVIEEILAEVKRIRAEQELPAEEPALS